MSTPLSPKDHFGKLTTSYEQLIGLATGDIGRYIVTLIPPPTPSTVIHDNACGTGLVTQFLQERAPSAHPEIQATDLTPGMVSAYEAKASELGWRNVHARVMDAQRLTTIPDHTFDVSIMNFGLFFLPEPQRGADEIYRTLKPGGTAIVTTWKRRPLFEVLRAAQSRIRPDLEPWTSAWAKPWESDDILNRTLVKARFREEDIREEIRTTRAIEEPFVRNPDIMAEAYPVVVKDWTDEDRARLGRTMLEICEGLEGGVGEGLSLVARIAVAKK